MVAMLYSQATFHCVQPRSEPEAMVKLQRHRLLHLRLQLVHWGVCDQRIRGLWVLHVVVVEQLAKPWFDATVAVELSDA